MKKAIVNIYNFIRMSNSEPSRFIQDDFDAIRNELIHVKQHGFPGTYALKYDALMEPRYQDLLREYLDENDEISAWWEISEPLCRRAGIAFHDTRNEEKYDDRLGSAYSLGYSPEERKKLVDAYMADFYEIFGKYPETIGSWVLDSVTLQYAADKYGVVGGAICRDQIGTDGFTLWGGFPTGIYYPSRKNEFIPAQTAENQMSVPMFRLLGPDPIYNFEEQVRPEHSGVFTLEPAWLVGRDPNWIRWIFTRLTDEDSLGCGYAQVGQENGFLWDNIEPGYAPQLNILEELSRKGNLRIETMGTTARWFRKQYTRTPPLTYQASFDWDKKTNLSAMWYASSGYRLGFLGEKNHLRIRDFLLYDENYCSRYLTEAIKTPGSLFDALPVLSPQLWKLRPENRPFIRLVNAAEEEAEGTAEYHAVSDSTAEATLTDEKGHLLAKFTMTPGRLRLDSSFTLRFDYLPSFEIVPAFESAGETVLQTYCGSTYGFRIAQGTLRLVNRHCLEIIPKNGSLLLELMPTAEGPFRVQQDIPDPEPRKSTGRPMPPAAPEANPGESVFPWGTTQKVCLTCREPGEIRYTLDGTEPTPISRLYTNPLPVIRDTVICAKLFRKDGLSSETARFSYRFGLKHVTLSGPTVLDSRPAFRGNGLSDLLQVSRGNTDYLCGRWRGTLDNLDVTARLDKPRKLRSVTIGFLSNHRSGIVLPESVELYAGPDTEHMTLRQTIPLPCAPCEREIVRKDISFALNDTVGAVRVLAKRYRVLPEWSCYRGDEHVFTLSDCLILVPESNS